MAPAGAAETRAALEQTVEPEYPAGGTGDDGVVTLRFTVGADGQVHDAKVEHSDPPGIFDATALASVGNWRYRPRMVDGVAVAQPDTLVRLRIKAPPTAKLIHGLPGLYPIEALQQRLEGTVKLSLDVGVAGDAKNVMVLNHVANGAFDKAAVATVSDWVFAPPVVDGKPTPVENVVVEVPFTLAKAEIAASPLAQKPPNYPPSARHDNENGFCVVAYHITDDGTVDQAVVRYSMPRDAFDEASLAAVRQWRFVPPSTETGYHVRQISQVMFRYTIEGSQPPKLRPGEWVKVSFTLEPDGTAADVKVASQSKPGLDTSSAIYQVRRARFLPHYEAGVPVEEKDKSITVYGTQD